MNLDHFLRHLKRLSRDEDDAHTLHRKLTDRELAAWQAKHPGVVLPASYLELLRRHNGIQLHINDEEGGALNVYSLRDVTWVLDLKFNYGLPWAFAESEQALMKGWLGIGVDGNGDRTLAIDTKTGEFLDLPRISTYRPMERLADADALCAWMVENYGLEIPEPGPKTKRLGIDAPLMPVRKSKGQQPGPMELSKAFELELKGLAFSLAVVAENTLIVTQMNEPPAFISLARREVLSELKRSVFGMEDGLNWRWACADPDSGLFAVMGFGGGLHNFVCGDFIKGEAVATADLEFTLSPSPRWVPGREICIGPMGADDAKLIMIDATTGKLAATLSGHPSAICGLAVSKDGRWATSTSGDGRMMLWDIQARALSKELLRQQRSVDVIALSADGGTLAVVSKKRHIRMIDVPRNEFRQVFTVPSEGTLFKVAYSDDGRFLATSDEKGWMWLLRAEDGAILRANFIGTPMDVMPRGSAFNPVQDMLFWGKCLITCRENTIQVWELPNG